MTSERRTETQRRDALLDGFTAEQWERFLGYTETERYQAGDTIIAQGQIERTLYVVLQGRLDVSVTNAQGVRRSIDLLEPGAAFGEMAFFDQAPRSASVVALVDAVLLRLRPDVFDLMRRRDPDLACAFALELGRALSGRFRRLLDERLGA